MAFFSKNNDKDTDQTPRNPANVLTFRVLAVGYVAYLCIQMVQTYTEGGPDAPTLPMLIVGLLVLGGGAIFLAILTYKEWKRNKPIYDAAMADLRAEAEEKRALEEAAEAEEADVDDDCDDFDGEELEAEDAEPEDTADTQEELPAEETAAEE